MKRMFVNKSMQGFTLLELLIAMTLGLFLMGGVMSVFISSKQSYAQQDALGQMQENARFALEMLARDTRMIGAGGCSSEINVANSLDNYNGAATDFANGLTGYLGDASNSSFPATFKGDSSPNTDAIILHSVEHNGSLVVNEHNPASATIKYNAATSLKPGDILVMVDANCTSMAIFANTGPTNNGNNATQSVHNEGNISGVNYDNCTKALKGSFTCDDASGALSLAYSKGSSVYKIKSFAYFIGPSSADATILSLYKKDVVGAGAAEELVEGITDLEMFYGLKTSNKVQYHKANNVGAGDWANVQSVRYKITARSLSLVSGAPISKTFTTTVKLRNRG